jgi:ribonuclease HII
MPSRKSSAPEQLGLGWDGPGLVAGVDEAGRGPLAGPVVAAAVILDDLKPGPGLARLQGADAARRERLYDEIMAGRCACRSPRPARGDRPPEHPAGHAAGHAARRRRPAPAAAPGAGRRQPLPVLKVPAQPSSRATPRCRPSRPRPSWPRCTATACAWTCTTLPGYGFDGHKGYPTAEHLQALREHGPVPGAPPQLCAGAATPNDATVTGRAAAASRPRQPAAGAPAQACATVRPTAGSARCGWKATTCARAAARGRRGGSRRWSAESAWPDAACANWPPCRAVVRLPDACSPASARWSRPPTSASCWTLPAPRRCPMPAAPRVVLDRLQDAGNVGSILRSAARWACGRCWRSRARPRCGRPRCCAPAWVRTSGCAWSKGWRGRDCWPWGAAGRHQFACRQPLARRPHCRGPAPGCWGTKGRACRHAAGACVRCGAHPAAGRRGVAERGRCGGHLLYEALRVSPGDRHGSVDQPVGPQVAQDGGGDLLDRLVVSTTARRCLRAASSLRPR